MRLQEFGFSSLNMLLYDSCGGDDLMPGGPYMNSGGGGGIIIGGYGEYPYGMCGCGGGGIGCMDTTGVGA
jgi:hypothetical protein